MIKRLLDIVTSLIGLICFSPILLFVSILVWRNDKKSPFYIPPRVGKKGIIFYMIKLRSMVVNADKVGIDSTSNNDLRITSIGQKIRKYKLDELKKYLSEKNIGTLIQWGGKGIHHFEQLGFTQKLPNTDKFFERCIMLPMNIFISNEDVEYICNSIKSFYRK